MMEIVGFVLIIAATAGATVFVILYALFAAWRKSDNGRHIMFLTFGLAALGNTSIIRRIVGTEWLGYDTLVAAIYGLLAWQLWRRVYLFLTYQPAGPEENKGEEVTDETVQPQ